MRSDLHRSNAEQSYWRLLLRSPKAQLGAGLREEAAHYLTPIQRDRFVQLLFLRFGTRRSVVQIHSPDHSSIPWIQEGNRLPGLASKIRSSLVESPFGFIEDRKASRLAMSQLPLGNYDPPSLWLPSMFTSPRQAAEDKLHG
jgi:hypothetical protein